MHKGESKKIQATVQKPIKLLYGVFLALFITVVMLAISSFLVSAGVIRESLMGQITAFSCTIGAFGGGLTGAKTEKRPILSGLIIGALLFLLLFLIGVLVYDVTTIGKEGMILGLSCLCGGMLSGVLSPKSAPKRKKGEGRGKRKKW